MTVDPTQEGSQRFQRQIERRKKEILDLEKQVLDRREKVHSTARRKAKEKQDFLNGNFVKSWQQGFKALKDSEEGRRMSDKQLPVRSYSLVDNEVWRMAEIRRWFDSHSSPQAAQGFDPLASGYTTSGSKNEDIPASLQIQRVPTPQWAAAEDRKIRQELQRKREVATSLKELKDEHFSDFEGNLQVQKARAAVLATRLKPPKGWGAQHTHVSGFRSPPWKERPPQEAPRYVSPQLLRERDLFIQAGGGLEDFSSKAEETKRRTTAMRAGSGIFGGGHH